MAEFSIRLSSQEGRDAHGRLQSHQCAEVPAELAGAFMSGGLKKIRRMAEAYFSFRFSPAAAQVRGVWRSGEPSLRRQFHGVPFVHGRRMVSLGRLRSAGTLDVYRGYHEIRGGEIVSNAARVLGIELLVAAHAIDCMRPLATTPELQRVHHHVREQVPYRAHDHRLDRDIAALSAVVESGVLSQFIG